MRLLPDGEVHLDLLLLQARTDARRVASRTTAPAGTQKLLRRIDEAGPVATAESAVPPTQAVASAFDTSSEPGACRWAALVATDPLPPPAPPPRV